jgi:hypothetical protein
MHWECAEIAARAKVDGSSRRLDRVHESLLDIDVLYNSQPRPDLLYELRAKEKFVLVTA